MTPRIDARSRHRWRWRWRSRSRSALAALLLAAALAPLLPVAAQTPVAGGDGDGTTVVTDAGPVVGVVAGDSRLFQGIPYAAPPVGDRRWRSPQPVAPWTEPRDATAPGNRCPQVGDPFNGPASDQEDCLFLNLTVPPSATPDRPRPVMVWMHGGGLVGGAGSDYDARRLAVDGDVVVVTVNYRLGSLGFFAHPALPGSGAYGLEDQQAALRWVQRNAAAFGGDPANVTLFGESAGGVGVCAHLASPSAAGLFHRAINQSGGCLGDWPAGVFPGAPAFSAWASTAEIEAIGAAVAPDVGCADPATAAACLRALPVGELLPGNLFFNRPAVGSPVLPESPERVLREGRLHRMPILSGHTRDEGTIWAGFQPQPITPERYPELLAEAFGGQAARVAAEYPVGAFETPGLAWAAVITDHVWACPTLDGHRLFAERAPTFVYRFDDRDAPAIFPETPEIPLGAYHGSDVPSLFDTSIAAPPVTLAADQQRLADRMIRYWANFARTGDPNGRGLPAWPRFRTSDPQPHVQGLAPGDGGIGPVDVAADHRCGFWESLGPAR